MQIAHTTSPLQNFSAHLRGLAIATPLILSGQSTLAETVTFITSSETAMWVEQAVKVDSQAATPSNAVQVHPETAFQTIDGFGGCFNELGWKALQTLTEADRQLVIRALFDPVTGCGFNLGRMPIGASDFALDWYSLDETPEDYDLIHFSIERDLNCLIPYIKAALLVNPKLQIWGSPWSPPKWMKTNNNYAKGTLRFEPQVQRSYARYLGKYVESYQAAGVPVYAVHVQNEPVAAQPFPSCLWTGEQERDFIRDYLGPDFAAHGVKAQIWLGTINDGDVEKFAVPVLSDPQAAKYITGVGYQWAGKDAIAATAQRFPKFKLMQTETQCGGGQNNWMAAIETWRLLNHYLSNGANSYMYWNMVLDQKSISTWGWKQNAMITVNTDKHTVTYNPEFYLMKHFSSFVQPGAKRIEATGRNDVLAFLNEDSSIVVLVANMRRNVEPFSVSLAGKTLSATLPILSISTLLYRP